MSRTIYHSDIDHMLAARREFDRVAPHFAQAATLAQLVVDEQKAAGHANVARAFGRKAGAELLDRYTDLAAKYARAVRKVMGVRPKLTEDPLQFIRRIDAMSAEEIQQTMERNGIKVKP